MKKEEQSGKSVILARQVTRRGQEGASRVARPLRGPRVIVTSAVRSTPPSPSTSEVFRRVLSSGEGCPESSRKKYCLERDSVGGSVSNTVTGRANVGHREKQTVRGA